MTEPNKIMWAVMKEYRWDSLTVNGITLAHDPFANGCTRFIPVFENREDAVKFNGCEAGVSEIITGPDNERRE